MQNVKNYRHAEHLFKQEPEYHSTLATLRLHGLYGAEHCGLPTLRLQLLHQQPLHTLHPAPCTLHPAPYPCPCPHPAAALPAAVPMAAGYCRCFLLCCRWSHSFALFGSSNCVQSITTLWHQIVDTTGHWKVKNQLEKYILFLIWIEKVFIFFEKKVII